MAGSSLLLLIDDIAALLDDVAVMTKVAAKKTAGVLGDDLALNAEQVAGVRAERELPVVWAVAKGSLKNKVILVPLALLISFFAPWAVIPLLMIGGLYLCLEGVEKLAHKWLHSEEEIAAEHAAELSAFTNESVDLAAFEAEKIKGAIRTDFVLSAEIIVIALGTVADKAIGAQFAVLATVALLMTIGVYGFVAAIVKMDDVGLFLLRKYPSGLLHHFGRFLLLAAPKLMKALTVIGTAAMFLVGGSILSHGVPFVHHLAEEWSHAAGNLGFLINPAVDLTFGLICGAIALPIVHLAQKLMKGK